MNPEEGELRPQLLDRFGLCVDVTAPTDVAERAEAVRRRLAHDAGGDGGGPDFAAADVVAGRRARVRDARRSSATTCSTPPAGWRSPSAPRACAPTWRCAGPLPPSPGWTAPPTRRSTTSGASPPLVLAHRARRSPYDPPVIPPEQLADAIDDALDAPPPDAPNDREEPDDRPRDGDTPERPLPTDEPRRRPRLPDPPIITGDRGRFVRAVPTDGDRSRGRRCRRSARSPPGAPPIPPPSSTPTTCGPTSARRGRPG